MANCKELRVKGWAPFDFVSRGDEELHYFVALMSGPCLGFRLSWPGRAEELVTETGGRYSYHWFLIEGYEAASYDFIENGCKAMRRAGCRFEQAAVRDIAETHYRNFLDDINKEPEIPVED